MSAALPEMRVGHGWDMHALVNGRPLVLGGVEIPHGQGPLGHSDGDVLLHAIIDAMLGAAALGDIGTLFPDHDREFAGADSRTLLAQAARRVAAAGWRIANVDSTVIAQAPRIAPWRNKMVVAIADALGLAQDCVSVKAKTAEHLGAIGQGSAIAAHAVLLLARA